MVPSQSVLDTRTRVVAAITEVDELPQQSVAVREVLVVVALVVAVVVEVFGDDGIYICCGMRSWEENRLNQLTEHAELSDTGWATH